jgi:hypothetical protein
MGLRFMYVHGRHIGHGGLSNGLSQTDLHFVALQLHDAAGGSKTSRYVPGGTYIDLTVGSDRVQLEVELTRLR